MKLYVLSDLHLEFADFEPDFTALALADVVVLPGDIDAGVAGIEWAARAFAGKPVIYVCGNHEFYGQHWRTHLRAMAAAARPSSIHFLEDSSAVVDGVRFLGASLWTNFCLYGRAQQRMSMRFYEAGLNDCRRISASTTEEPLAMLTPAHVLERHITSRRWLESELSTSFPGKTVVVSHHAPTRRSVALKYQSDPLTPAFASELPSAIMETPVLWVHGHMHDSCDYRGALAAEARTCRVLCNPRGYPLDRSRTRFENPRFDPALIVEI